MNSARRQRSDPPATATLVALLSAGLAIGATHCGLNDSVISLHEPSSTSLDPAQCSVHGDKCAFGCAADLGCVECEGDRDCPTDLPACVLGQCHQCQSSADCSAEQGCFPADHRCEDGCTGDADCGGNEPFCDLPRRACLGCRSNQDCAANKPACEPSAAQCVVCSSDAHCHADRPICDRQVGKCEECLVDGQCPAGALCGADHHCHRSCTDDAQCADPDEPFCSPARSECSQCLVDAHCPPEAPYCKEVDECVPCLDDAHCPVGLPACVDDQCVECEGPEDCSDPALPRCEEGRCMAA